MRSVFLISAILLHVSWCYAFPDRPWFPDFFNPYDFPNFINRFKLPEGVKRPEIVQITSFSDVEASAPAGSPGSPGGYYSISHNSYVSNSNGDGKVHSKGKREWKNYEV